MRLGKGDGMSQGEAEWESAFLLCDSHGCSPLLTPTSFTDSRCGAVRIRQRFLSGLSLLAQLRALRGQSKCPRTEVEEDERRVLDLGPFA